MSDEEFFPYKSPRQEFHADSFKRGNWKRVADAVASACKGALVVGGIGTVFGPVALLFLCVVIGDFGGPLGLLFSLMVVGAVGFAIGAVIGAVAGLIVSLVRAESESRAQETS